MIIRSQYQRLTGPFFRVVVPMLGTPVVLLLVLACRGTPRVAPTLLPASQTASQTASTIATTIAAPVPGRSRAHIHRPGVVRGVELYPVFARAIIAPMYLDGLWLVAPDSAASVGAFLASLSPTLVSGLFSFAPEEVPTETHRRVLNTIRDAVREGVPLARFDVYLDALTYPSGPSVVQHMRVISERLTPDVWMFTRWDQADRQNFAVVASAANHAHTNGQSIGGTTESGDIPSDSDFGVLLGNVSPRQLTNQLTALTAIHPLPYLVAVGETGNGVLPALPSGIQAFPLWRIATRPGLPGLTFPQATAHFRP
jgi:hypothetical protein